MISVRACLTARTADSPACVKICQGRQTPSVTFCTGSARRPCPGVPLPDPRQPPISADMSRPILDRRRLLTLVSFGVAGFIVSPAMAANTAGAVLSEQDRGDVARVQEYLNAIRTLSARFMQISDTGGTAEGKLYL